MSSRMISILLVEDEESHVELINRSFGSGFANTELTMAHTLQEARLCIKKTSFDLIILDMVLPDGSGLNLLSRYHKQPPFPVVVMTAHGDEEAAVEAMKAGILDYVVKSDENFANMPHIARRAMREWKHIIRYREAEAKLKDRNIELEHSNKELDDFAYTVSHDLKEPLRGIRGYSSMLIDSYAAKLDKEALARLDTMTNLAGRLENMIGSLLRYSKAGRMELVIKKVNIHNVVSQIIDSLQLIERKSTIKIEMPKNFPTVMCDRIQIGEVFRNLISNAIKYNDRTEKRIEIGCLENPGSGNSKDTAENPEDENGKLIFYVRDNGIGIRPRHRESIFGIFKRLNARDQYGSGTGAGLTIVKKIINRHGGRIWVESTYGEGTTFYFTLHGGSQNND